MVAGPVTGAEGDEQTGRETPELGLWSEFGIPAQRAEETPRASGEADAGAEAAPATAAAPVIPTQPLGETLRQSGQASERTAAEFPAAPGETVRQIGQAPEATALGFAAAPGETVRQSGRTPEGRSGAGAAEFSAVPLTAPVVEPLADAEPTQVAEKPKMLRSARSHRSRMRRQTSNGVIVVACLAVIFLVLHRFLPDAGGMGSMLETWLPWAGAPILLLFVIAAIVHTKRAIVVTLVAALAWTALYGPTLLPRGSSATQQLRIFSEDVNGNAQEATASGTMALAQKADIVALEDMYSSVYASNAVNALNSAYANHATEYEFGLWSRYPIADAQPIALGTTQTSQALSLGADSLGLTASASGVPIIGALKATLTTPKGALTVYLVHLPQPVLGDQGFAKVRDAALTKLVQLIQADHSARIAVIGDVNTAATDRQFGQLTKADGLTSAQQASGSGFGFTWPAEFPVVRLDDVLTKGLTPLRSVVMPAIAHGQAHLPIQVDLNY